MFVKFCKTYLAIIYCLLQVLQSPLEGNIAANSKILICGVGRNIASALINTITNIEALGDQFADYSVIIYENNSTDGSGQKLKNWATRNPKVQVISEFLSSKELSIPRVERIAKARNIVLSLARDQKYGDYDYLLWADLDFVNPWPLTSIVKTLEAPIEWDCVSANGVKDAYYWDRYAFRNKEFPLGPEILGEEWWKELGSNWFSLAESNWIPVYSAFGGLAIYKMKSIINFSYSATPTTDLQNFYRAILASLPDSNLQKQKYLNFLSAHERTMASLPIHFQVDGMSEGSKRPVCCEHVVLHASMYLAGFNKFFINPKMIIKY